MSQPLAQVLDKASLDAHEGSRARLKITVPAGWMEAGALLDVQAPKIISCDRCDGGGCDGCERSGALRAPDDESARRLRLSVPASDASKALLLRLTHPFEGAPIDQLLVQVSPGETPSRGVIRVEAIVVAPSPGELAAPWAKLALVAAAIIAVIAALSI